MDLLLPVTCELLSALNVARKAITSEMVGLKSKMQNAALSFLKGNPRCPTGPRQLGSTVMK